VIYKREFPSDRDMLP